MWEGGSGREHPGTSHPAPGHGVVFSSGPKRVGKLLGSGELGWASAG